LVSALDLHKDSTSSGTITIKQLNDLTLTINTNIKNLTLWHTLSLTIALLAALASANVQLKLSLKAISILSTQNCAWTAVLAQKFVLLKLSNPLKAKQTQTKKAPQRGAFFVLSAIILPILLLL
jgi:hypothetical protein